MLHPNFTQISGSIKS